MDAERMAERFLDEIKLRAFSDHYLDKKEEREILQVAIAEGVSAATARAALLLACQTNGYVLESDTVEKTKELLDRLSQSAGQIDEKEFQEAVAFLQQQNQGRKDEAESRRIVLELIQANNYHTTHGWFSSWFNKLKKEVGLA